MKEWVEGELEGVRSIGFKKQSRNQEPIGEASIEDMERKDSRREEP